jgi:hypothetical protein
MPEDVASAAAAAKRHAKHHGLGLHLLDPEFEIAAFASTKLDPVPGLY